MPSPHFRLTACRFPLTPRRLIPAPLARGLETVAEALPFRGALAKGRDRRKPVVAEIRIHYEGDLQLKEGLHSFFGEIVLQARSSAVDRFHRDRPGLPPDPPI
jgi:hypothetical protein